MRLVRLLKYVLVGVVGLYLPAAVLYAIPVVSGALDDTMEVKFSRADPSIVADYGNGLTPGQRETFYHLSQGAEILEEVVQQLRQDHGLVDLHPLRHALCEQYLDAAQPH